MAGSGGDKEWIHRSDLRDLVGIDQLRDLLGQARRDARRGERVARSYAVEIANSKGFPDPVVAHPSAADPQIRLWLRVDVEAWLDRHRPGWSDPLGR
ncbi:hypothetical protein ACG83_10225 [Frankia sp. R43]|uniref:hypothetical protein n=1 Tax=Frankia sp. R43 TaxID=269536 RepID=UPI0006CA4E5A|nr:hypothetical protein [Frankia sp. R43]KPM55657.1 hypothetical protein ACG83_10225 [Frankia sp. R43]